MAPTVPGNIPLTINGLLAQAKTQWSDRPYLKIRTGTQVHVLTFGEVIKHAEAIAGGLLELGVRPGERIALLSENRPAWIINYLAGLLAGTTVVPVDSLMAPAEIVNILKIAHVRLLVTTRKFLDAIQAVEEGKAASQNTYLMDEEDDPDYPPLPKKAGVPLPEVKPSDTAVIIFTSGTTGFSKGVVLSHANLCADAQAMVNAGVIIPDDNFHLLLPLHHTYSSTVNMIGSLATGASATFATSYKSRDIVDDIRIAGVTMLIGVPQVFENIMIGIRRGVSDAPAVKQVMFRVLYAVSGAGGRFGLSLGKSFFRSLRTSAGLGSLRLMVSGGAALPVEVNRFFENLGITLLQGYGLTETSPVLTVNKPWHNRLGSVGPALPGVTLKIENPDADGIGEICARGPMIMQGYFENPSATADVLREGWFHTGDAGFLDKYGCLHITGRIKNIIVTGAGKNVYPEEIEAVLNLSPYILESLVLGVKRKRGAGEELAAIIQPDLTVIEGERERGTVVDMNAEVKKVVDDYNKDAPSHRQIRQWKLRDEDFNKTSTRKIRRYLYLNIFQPTDQT